MRYALALFRGEKSIFHTFWVIYMPVNILSSLCVELLPETWVFGTPLFSMLLLVQFINIYWVGVGVIRSARKFRPFGNWEWFVCFSAGISMLIFPAVFALGYL